MHINYLTRIKKNYIGISGLVLLTIIVCIAVCAPLLPLHSPWEPSVHTMQDPSRTYWLGTNEIGQDILSRLIYGARTTLTLAFLTGFFTTLLSVSIGASSALFGGLYDRIMMRIADIFLALPSIIMIILVASYLRPGIWLLAVFLSMLSWQGGARAIRAQALSLKNGVHIYAATTFGAGKTYILFKHIIPDLVPLMIVEFIQAARRTVFMEASLAFLGLLDITLISWGTMLHRALNFSYLNAWNWLLPPGIALSLTILALTFIGYGLEDILNHRQQEKKHVTNY